METKLESERRKRSPKLKSRVTINNLDIIVPFFFHASIRSRREPAEKKNTNTGMASLSLGAGKVINEVGRGDEKQKKKRRTF